MKKIMVFILAFAAFSLYAQENSYKFELGKYRIYQYRANIRVEPDRSSKVVAVLNFLDEIEILENSGKEEAINDVWGYWYKIKYGNIIGYTFGGNIAVKTVIFDIDRNGIDDYFCFRVSGTAWGGWADVNSLKDIKIYINNKEFSTKNLIYEAWWHSDYYVERAKREGIDYDWCDIREYNGNIMIELADDQRCWVNKHIFNVSANGNIEYIRTEDWIDEDW